jgi:NACHT domain
MPDISIAVALLKKPLEALGALAKGKTQEVVKRLKAESNVREIHQKLTALQKIKTIWNFDRALTISSFYYPASIAIGKQTQLLNGLDDLPSNLTILQGTAGQGKSILLRWLIGREIKTGTRIPLFLELRRIQKDKFNDHLVRTFGELFGVGFDQTTFDFFAANGRISLLLDGFDEVDPDHMQLFADEIERLSQKFPKLRIVVTSRPDGVISKSPLFETVDIAPLNKDDLQMFFARILSRDRDLLERLKSAIKTAPKIVGLVSTPLLATLLTIVYRAHQKIPLDFAEFYEELFAILLVRHDKSKLGYERFRKTGLSDREIESVFEAFCFRTRVQSKNSLTRNEALTAAKDAIAMIGIQCKEEAFLFDIAKVTCLLSEDGGRYEFVHQSVQEFFASGYIKSRPEMVAQKFYEQLLQAGRWQAWQQELTFLGQRDRYRSSKYFYVAALSATLEYLQSQKAVAETVVLRKTISDQMAVIQKITSPDGGKLNPPKYYVRKLSSSLHFMQSVYDERMHSLLFKQTIGSVRWSSAFDKLTGDQLITYTDIANVMKVNDQLDVLLVGTTKYLLSELEVHHQAIVSSEETMAFVTL